MSETVPYVPAEIEEHTESETEGEGITDDDKDSRCCGCMLPRSASVLMIRKQFEGEGCNHIPGSSGCNSGRVGCAASFCVLISLLVLGISTALRSSGDSGALGDTGDDVRCYPLAEAPVLEGNGEVPADELNEVRRRLQVGPDSSMLDPSIMSAPAPASPPSGVHMTIGRVHEDVSSVTIKPTGSPEDLAPKWQKDVEHGIKKLLGEDDPTQAPPTTTVATTCIPLSMIPTTTLPPTTRLCARNSRDDEIWRNGDGAQNFESAMAHCVQRCQGASPCVTDCIQEEQGYSKACAGCFGNLAACTHDSCLLACAGINATNSTCTGCVHQLCNPGFWSCTGLNRQVLLDALAI